MGKKQKKSENKKLTVKTGDLLKLARENIKKDDISQSGKYFREALRQAKAAGQRESLALAYYGLVLSLLNKKQSAEAVGVLAEARAEFGGYPDLYFLETAVYNDLSDFEKALESARSFLSERDKKDTEYESYLTQTYNNLNDALWMASEAARRTLNIKESLEYQKKAVKIDPGHHFRRIVFATNLGKDGRIEAAIEVLEEGSKLYPHEIAFENAKALVYGDGEMFDQAFEVLSNILKKHPKDVDALVNYGVTLEKRGDYDGAEQYYNKAIAIDPKHEVAVSNLRHLKNTIDKNPQKISLCMIVKNEEKFLPQCLESAKDLADEIILVDTGSTDRTMEIAAQYGAKIYQHPWQNDFSLHRNQSIDYATGNWILILDADEELEVSEHDMIRNAAKRKDIDAVSFVVLNKIQQGRTGFLNSHRLFRNRPEFRYDGIVHNQLKMEGVSLASPLKVYHHGYGLSDDQMKAKAKRTEALLLKQLEEDPDNAFSHFNLAQIYRGMSRPDLSVEHALKAIELIGPDDVDHRHVYIMALDQIGCGYEGLNQLEKSREYFYKALEIKEDYLDPMFNLGYVFAKGGEYDKAVEAFHRYLTARDCYSEHREWHGLILNNLNSQFSAYYGMGLSMFMAGKIDKAIEYLNTVIEMRGDYEFTHHLLARCYRAKKNLEKIHFHCDQAIGHGHTDAEIYLLKGETYLNQKLADKAAECFNKSLEFDTEYYPSLLGLASAASLDGDNEKSLKLVNRLLEKYPTAPQVLMAKGDLLYEFGNYASAAGSYQTQSRQNPNDYASWNNLGNCFLKQSNFSSAEECYRMSLENQPDFPFGYRNLAVSLMKQNKNEESISYFEKYLTLIPGDTEVQAVLGDLHYNNKNYWTAIPFYERYIRKNPKQFEALLRLADCYLNLGKISSAMAGYKAVLQINPGNQLASNRLRDIDEYGKMPTIR